MYHPKTNQTRLLHTLISVITGLSAILLPVRASGDGTGEIKTSAISPWQLLPSVPYLRKHPVQGVEVYQYDQEPIDNRAPFLMVHGLDGENKDCFRWRMVCNTLEEDQAFHKKFKLLLARYSTHIAISEVVPNFQHALAAVSANFGGKAVTTIALSMGGNLIQQSMANPETSSKIERILTMGTPFHGSPLFANDWMRFSMAKHYRLPIMRVDNCLPYSMYFDRHRNLLADLPWDNCDRKIPDVGPFRFIFPYPINGIVTPLETTNEKLTRFTAPGAIDKSKFIVYGGYLNSAVADDTPDNFLLSTIKYPIWLLCTKVPEHCGAEHSVLRVLNSHIAHTITVPPSKKRATTSGARYLYGLNDGITPLSSALFLPDLVLNSHEFKSSADVPALKHVVDVRKARVFHNIDHLTFIDGYHPRGRSEQLRDELAPTAPERTIFRWILTDLMDMPEQARLAADPKTSTQTKD